MEEEGGEGEEAKAAGAWKPEEPHWGCRPRRCLPGSQKADLQSEKGYITIWGK